VPKAFAPARTFHRSARTPEIAPGRHYNRLALRVLLVNQFYPPDMAPTGQHLHELARCLAERGHLVEVLASSRSYEGGGEYAAEEVLDEVRVRRVSAFAFGRRGAGRAADYLSFAFAACWRAFRLSERYDATLCLTTPPYVGWAVPLALGGNGGAVAHWIMDLYPDVLAAHGGFPAAGPLYRAMRRLTRMQLSRSALVLTLGLRMQEKVRAYASDGSRLECVPLWSSFLAAGPDAEVVASMRLRRGWSPDELVLLYSGNMGLGHRFEEFLHSAGRPWDGSSVVWAFAGGGQRRGEVERFVLRHPQARVQILPYVSQAELPASLAAADVHLISMRSPWQGVIVPSKLQAAFGLGRPVIFVGPRDTESADWIAESGGGWYVAEGDEDGLFRAVAAARDPAERRRRGEAGRAFARDHFDPAKNTTRIAELLECSVRTAGQNSS
jgi:colanic acid biosynthesis glycosyl transferase WcaI